MHRGPLQSSLYKTWLLLSSKTSLEDVKVIFNSFLPILHIWHFLIENSNWKGTPLSYKYLNTASEDVPNPPTQNMIICGLFWTKGKLLMVLTDECEVMTGSKTEKQFKKDPILFRISHEITPGLNPVLRNKQPAPNCLILLYVHIHGSVITL